MYKIQNKESIPNLLFISNREIHMEIFGVFKKNLYRSKGMKNKKGSYPKRCNCLKKIEYELMSTPKTAPAIYQTKYGVSIC